MSWRSFTIEPIDVWLFRDGRPFSAGSDVWARSLSMPSPFTLLGALRAFFLTQRGISPKEFYEGRVVQDQDLKKQWGGPGADPGQLELIGPFWYRERSLYFPVPADVVRVGDKWRLLQPLRPDRAKLVEMNLPSPLGPLWVKAAGAVESESGYLSYADFQKYLSLPAESGKELSSLRILPSQAFLERERRTGLKISPRRTAEEGFLYQVEFLRLCEGVQLCGFARLPNGTEPQNGILFLGGERRMGFLKWDSLSEGEPLALRSLRRNNQERLKVILLSPAYFSEGWKPKDWGEIGLGGYQLVAAAIPRLTPVSIFEKKGKNIFQKRLYCVPPGSVYFFEKKESKDLQEQNSPPPFDRFTEEPSLHALPMPSQADQEKHAYLPLKKLGFGLYATSTWNYA